MKKTLIEDMIYGFGEDEESMVQLQMVSESELLQYNRLGLIPGPDEGEAEFLKRVNHCLHLKEHLGGQIGEEMAAELDNAVAQELLKKSAPTMRRLFDIAPTWIPILFTDHHMAPWHGGCAWIFQSTEETPVAAFFQLRRVFARAQNYLWIYDRDELIAHESAHVGRMMFQEPKFEELLAYRTAKSGFRRWFGPIIQSSWEGFAFLISLMVVIGIDFFLIASPSGEREPGILWLRALPLVLLALGLGRLLWKQHAFHKCLHNVMQVINDEEKANGVVYRLLDKEIKAFSSLQPEEIRKYAEKMKDDSLRWHVIVAAYF